jgi:hypothetical protein
VVGAKAHAVMAFSYLMIIITSLTISPVAWVYAAEVWSLETRAVGMGICAIGNWVFNFALGLYIPPGFQNIKWGMFIVFGAMCVIGAIQMFLTFPETGGKTLEEIEALFAPGAPRPWNTEPGHSRLGALIDEAREKHLTTEDVLVALPTIDDGTPSKDATEKRVEDVTGV